MDRQSTSVRGRRILIVEDEYSIAEEMSAEFEASGATVIGPASNTEDAIDLIERAQAIDGAILDINLQGEMVYPVADMLRRRGVPFVFATGYEPNAVRQAYRDVTVCEKTLRPGDIGAALFG